MRHQTERFVQKFIKEKSFTGNVLDVGAAYMGGARLWLLFPKGKYTGLDMAEAENVDIVMNAHSMIHKLSINSYDMVMCFDTFEHDDRFWETLEGMKFVLKPGGYMLIGVPARNCPEHRHPGDYWRFMPQCQEAFYEGFDDLYIDVQKDDPNHIADDEIYMWGRKQ